MALGRWVGALALIGAVAALVGVTTPTQAASFDCAKASTPYEQAICQQPKLSAADELLAKAFSTAIGGLTAKAADAMRTDQRQWLDFVQRVCTDDAKPLTSGSYDDTGASCLADKLRDRVNVLEASRMLGGHRFYLTTNYSAQPDPDEVDNPESYWKVTSHEFSAPLLDSDDALAAKFHAFITTALKGDDDLGATEFDDQSTDGMSFTVVKSVTTTRISLETTGYSYPHGAAHGGGSLGNLHYLIGEDRALTAADVFKGDAWQEKLTDLVIAQLNTNVGEWLQMPDRSTLTAIISMPARWSFEDPYGLTIQFQQYEVGPYAYGMPTVTISWENLNDVTADSLAALQ